MNQQQQIEFIEQLNRKGLELMKSKGGDYADKWDVLLNFKQMQQLMVLLNVDTKTQEGVHVFYLLLKMQRLCNLLFSGKTPNNESLQDTLLDLRNYVDLLNFFLHEPELMYDKA